MMAMMTETAVAMAAIFREKSKEVEESVVVNNIRIGLEADHLIGGDGKEIET